VLTPLATQQVFDFLLQQTLEVRLDPFSHPALQDFVVHLEFCFARMFSFFTAVCSFMEMDLKEAITPPLPFYTPPEDPSSSRTSAEPFGLIAASPRRNASSCCIMYAVINK
jgi:hypothetical protein